MANLIFTLATLLIIIFDISPVLGQKAIAPINLESRKKHEVSWPFIFNNLQACFDDVSKLEKMDPKFYSMINNKFAKAIAAKDSEYKDSQWSISHEYWLKSIPDLIFLEASDNDRVDGAPFDIAYDQSTDSLYLLNYITPEQINRIISPSKFSLWFDAQILDYCRLFTIIKYPAATIRFISSIQEILLEAVYANQGFYDLEQVKPADTTKLDIPSIKGMSKLTEYGAQFSAKDTIEVSFYMARNDQIIKVQMTMSKKNVLNYKASLISKTIDLAPHP